MGGGGGGDTFDVFSRGYRKKENCSDLFCFAVEFESLIFIPQV